SCNTIVLDSNVVIAVKKLWKNDVPSKVNVFGWRLLLEKLPTRAALNHRGIYCLTRMIFPAFFAFYIVKIAPIFSFVAILIKVYGKPFSNG
ncbi:hypothetical protein L195_g060848, partial [Trifolium pratense]